jgi:hypothetical protein
MGKLTKGQINRYIALNGCVCPYCGEDEEPNFDCTGLWMTSATEAENVMHCRTCKHTWGEIFRMVTIIEGDRPDPFSEDRERPLNRSNH